MHVSKALQSVFSAHFVIFTAAARGAAFPSGGVVHELTQPASVIFASGGLQAIARVQRA